MEIILKNNILKLKYDRRFYAENCLKIRDKSANIIPLVYNEGQEKLIKIIEEWDKKPEPKETLYIIILKARQIGFSTATEAVFFQDLNFSQDMVAMIVSYDEDSAQNINDMANRFYQYLPQVIKPQIRPARGKGIFLENPRFDPSKEVAPDNHPGLQNKFLIETARNVNAGSSYTIHRLHISELAKWPNPETTMTSLMQSVPDHNAIVIVESTALGMNYFYDLWTAAENGENNYVPIFVAWWENPDYESEYTGFELTPYENMLMKTIPVMNKNKLQWRRNIIADKLNGSEDMFRQEYPAFPEEAFLASGTPVYDVERVKMRIEDLKTKYKENPPSTYRIEFDVNEQGDPIKGTTRLAPDKFGHVTIYKHPEVGRPYVIGGDTAEGGIDFCAAQVLDNVTGEQVATIHINGTDLDIFAKELFALGHYYNEALIGVEINFDLHVTKELSRLGYYKQYRREVFDEISKTTQRKYGFRTTQTTRGPIIDETVRIVREEIHLLNDIGTLEEMLYFIRNPKKHGKPEADKNRHDDLIMAFAIAHAIRSQQRMYVKVDTSVAIPYTIPEDVRQDLEDDPEAITHYLDHISDQKLIEKPPKRFGDVMLQLCIKQGYVYPECQLDGQVVYLLIQEGKNPCEGCLADCEHKIVKEVN